VPGCPSCGGDYAEGARHCGHCGAPVDKTSAPTATSLKNDPAITSHPSFDQARFIPGTVLAKRYRIVGLLGRGGMGEVYRAEDLKLGQPVALKFLPEAVQRDGARLERLLNEVRVALKVSHPNVCRVHDIGEAEGLHYLSMEYVDGEDLASLLRRIGRLPEDKAVQIARQLCAGLAAAHEQGILHRDLKPANVMIDGRGRAKITDFGLAGLAEGIAGEDVRAGTPTYMAPEQLAGDEVTLRSDVFSLGLVLYELFTGKRAFDASTPAEMLRLERESTPTDPSSHVENLDPAIARAILQCLEREPAQRPVSALAISAALPGGDPLVAALAAGETPSPELVAAAGGRGSLHPWLGVALLVLALVGLVAHFHVEGLRLAHVRLNRPPEELSVIARQFLESVGHETRPRDHTRGLDYNWGYYRHLRDQEESSEPRANLFDGPQGPAAPIYFWYRQSPRDLLPHNPVARVSWRDPPRDVPGMTGLKLDGDGRLLSFYFVPSRFHDVGSMQGKVDWSPFFDMAGLIKDEASPTEPTWRPMLPCDDYRAWDLAHPDQPSVPIRVEAGSYGGRPVYFVIFPPWNMPSRASEAGPARPDVGFTLLILLYLVLLAAGALLARRNIRMGRADVRGAFRVAGFVFVARLLYWAFTAHHAPGSEAYVLLNRLSAELFQEGLMYWVFYVALEPYARRLWPELFVSWNRLLRGRLGDPRVGRDILVGAGTGWLIWGLFVLGYFVRVWLGAVPPAAPPPNIGALRGLEGLPQMFGAIFRLFSEALAFPIGVLFILLLMRVLLRRQWAAVAGAVVVVSTTFTLLQFYPSPIAWLSMCLISLVWVLVMVRFGFLVIVFSQLFQNGGNFLPVTTDPASWYFGRSTFVFVLLAALLIYGFHRSRAGQPLFKRSLLEES
jgi:serine/threonine-protein kinase